MYIADLEYHKYEAKLTRDMQDEGLAATLAVLGLTSTASLITVASTARVLSGAATVVTGADKAFNDKVLLSNTIQALQTQMRADRQTQAAAIFTKMATPLEQYTLPMALSDVEHYYQAGTLASALVSLNKTVANAEQNATTAHDLAGPNGDQVTAIKTIANPPPTSTRALLGAQLITNPNVTLVAPPPLPPPPVNDRLTPFERSLSVTSIRSLQAGLCVAADGRLGQLNSKTRTALAAFLQAKGESPSPTIDPRIWIITNPIRSKPSCSMAPIPAPAPAPGSAPAAPPTPH